jgi:hypothetical protein
MLGERENDTAIGMMDELTYMVAFVGKRPIRQL